MADLALEAGDAAPPQRRARPRRRPVAIGSWVNDTPEAPDPRVVGTNMGRILDARGIRWPWMAEKMGYHRTYFTRVVSGERPITREFVRRAMLVMDTPFDILFILAPGADAPDE